MGRKFKQKHWGLDEAASEFGCDKDTLAKYFKQAGQSPAFTDGTWATNQIVVALFGDYDAQKTRKITHEANLLELTEREKRGELVPMGELVNLMQRGLQAMTAYVMGLTDIEIERREKIIEQIRACGEGVVGGSKDSDASAEV
jgi:AraC-like DNA-binding protein